MPVPPVAEKYAGAIVEVTIGATKAEGGTRARSVTVGGAKTAPFMTFEGDPGRRPVVAMDVLDIEPVEWPAALVEPIRDVAKDPCKWARKCVEDFGADMICLRLEGTSPDKGKKSPEESAELVRAMLKAVEVPLIIWGGDDDAKNNEVMPAVGSAARGERCLLGTVTEDNYKRLAGVCLADGHCVISESPLDINICKQVNILLSDFDFPANRVVIFPTTGGLGYGLEYAYSIQERGRLAALQGDKMMAMPVIVTAGLEAWRAKEAKAPDGDEAAARWGPQRERGPMWEAITAVTLLQAGADIITLRHPKALAVARAVIDRMTA